MLPILSHSLYCIAYCPITRTGHSNKWTAVLDCAPLHVPITALLLPYGYGTYTAMQYWARGVVGSARGSGTSGGERAEPG